MIRSRRLYKLILASAMAAMVVVSPAPAAAQALTGWSDKQLAKRDKQFAKLDREHFVDTAEIDDDDLEVVATIHTREGHKFRGGFRDTVRADTFLRAMIDKTSGATVFQLYAHMTYTGDWRRFENATFASPDGPIGAQVTVINRDVDCKYGVCSYIEHLAFEIPEEVFITLAEQADTQPLTPWRFRLKAQSGLDWTDNMAPAELAGLLEAVERFKSDRGI